MNLIIQIALDFGKIQNYRRKFIGFYCKRDLYKFNNYLKISRSLHVLCKNWRTIAQSQKLSIFRTFCVNYCMPALTFSFYTRVVNDKYHIINARKA